MADDSPKAEIVEKSGGESAIVPNSIMIPDGFSEALFGKVMRELKDPNRQRGLAFENEKQRNAMAIRKGLTKPGRISYDTLRRVAASLHVARICINVLKEKITKTKWVVQNIDQMKRKDTSDARIKEVADFFKHPNQNNETFRTLLDKMLEDLLVLDAVSLEKTRYPDGTLAELHFVDSATIRPVFDEHGNQDIIIPLKTVNGEEELPVSYLQVLNNSQYGGPESGDVVAAWAKKDFIYFHMHPQGSMEGFGYGLSPLEGVLSVVSNLLNADNYNSTYFEEGAFPPVILNLVGQINQRDLNAFKEYFYQEISGNFHRPAVMASQTESKVINLKEFTNRDMQFMEFFVLLAKLLAAAYGLSPQDIGLTDDVNRSTSETMKDLSETKGYASVLNLLKEVFNQEIIWKDFGYEDLEFDWVAEDSTELDVASQVHDRALKNGTLTLNEVRLKNGDTPFGDWADKPMILAAEGYRPLMAEDNVDPEEEQSSIVGGEKPYKEQEGDEKGEEITKMNKSVLTAGGYKCWADDRGFAQPFIYQDIKSGFGTVIKPPVAVNLDSQNLEIELTTQLAGMGLNVRPMRKMTYVEVCDMLRNIPEVYFQFEKYTMMSEEYDSEKWRAKLGGSRKFAYYLVVDYIDGLPLSNPLLIADMKRDPKPYMAAIHDLAQLWKAEKSMLLGDRRPDQYIITHEKRGFGFDYQFSGDQERWEKTQGSILEALKPIPELEAAFKAATEEEGFSIKAIMKKAFARI